MFKHEAQNACMFTGTTPCDRNAFNFTNILCAKQANDVFSLAKKPMRLQGPTYETLRTVVLTEPVGCSTGISLFPFPLKLVNGTGVYASAVTGKELCVDLKQLLPTVTKFVHEKNLETKGYTFQQIQAVIHALLIYISSNTFTQQQNVGDNYLNLSKASQSYVLFNLENQKRLEAYYDIAGAVPDIGIIDETGELKLHPINKFPTVYQALFINFEVSEQTFTTDPELILPPNCMCNCMSHTVHTFDETPDNIIYRHTPNTDYATPLVLAGFTAHGNNSYTPFKRPPAIPGIYGSVVFPGACS